MNRGFTLIELLVAFSVGIMLIIGGTVAANNFNANQKLDAVTSEIEGNIRLAKNYAMTRQVPSGYNPSFKLGYVVVTLSNAGLMEILAGNSSGVDLNNKYLSKTINVVDMNVVINDDLIFSVPEGKLLDYLGGGPVTLPSAIGGSVVVTINGKSIEISAAGVIRQK